MKKKLELAIQDRNALLNFLTPEQREKLQQGMQTASQITQQGSQIIEQATQQITQGS
ncbi:MAG: hypothetical protein IT410_01245 [Candidatus Doudnabacteria bacterium]|nr:hypothetical protein [Candidatus Doudnabacteria bacterium]